MEVTPLSSPQFSRSYFCAFLWASALLLPISAAALESLSSERKKLENSLINFEARAKSFRGLPCLSSASRQHINSLFTDSQKLNLNFLQGMALFFSAQNKNEIKQCAGEYAESFSCIASQAGEKKDAALTFAEVAEKAKTEFENSYDRNFEQADIYTQDVGNDQCVERGFEERKQLETAAAGLTERFLAFSYSLEGLVQQFEEYQGQNQLRAGNAKSASASLNIVGVPQNGAKEILRPERLPSTKTKESRSDITGLKNPERL